MNGWNNYSGRSATINSSPNHTHTWGEIWRVDCYHCKASLTFWGLHSFCPRCGKPIEKAGNSKDNQIMPHGDGPKTIP